MYMLKCQAQELLFPFEELLHSIPADAVSKYIREFPNVRYQLGKRSDASIIHDLMILLAGERLDHLTEFAPRYSQGLHYYYVSNGQLSATIRFKKLNDRRRSSNIPTYQSLEFNHQDFQPILPDMPPIAKLTLGYTFNNARTSAEAVFLTMPHGDRNIWTWRLDGRSSEEIAPIPINHASSQREDDIISALRTMNVKEHFDGLNSDERATEI